jgi:hypothetical protein
MDVKNFEFASIVGNIKKIKEVMIRYGNTGISKGKFFFIIGSYLQNQLKLYQFLCIYYSMKVSSYELIFKNMAIRRAFRTNFCLTFTTASQLSLRLRLGLWPIKK